MPPLRVPLFRFPTTVPILVLTVPPDGNMLVMLSRAAAMLLDRWIRPGLAFVYSKCLVSRNRCNVPGSLGTISTKFWKMKVSLIRNRKLSRDGCAHIPAGFKCRKEVMLLVPGSSLYQMNAIFRLGLLLFILIAIIQVRCRYIYI